MATRNYPILRPLTRQSEFQCNLCSNLNSLKNLTGLKPTRNLPSLVLPNSTLNSKKPNLGNKFSIPKPILFLPPTQQVINNSNTSRPLWRILIKALQIKRYNRILDNKTKIVTGVTILRIRKEMRAVLHICAD